MPRPASAGTTPEITSWKEQRERRTRQPVDKGEPATLHTVIRAASGERRCPICEQPALADPDGLMLWHQIARGDGELVGCPGMSAPGNELLDGKAA